MTSRTDILVEAICGAGHPPVVGIARRIGGGFHVPSRAAALGAWSLMVIPRGPVGAGSQLDSLSAPGELCRTQNG
jgi:hypothetical protein